MTTLSEIVTLDFAEYYPDGTISVKWNPENSLEYEGVIPSPDVNTKSEEERKKRHSETLKNITLRGYFTESTQRIHNEAFDKKNQKTTLKVKYRSCRTEKEAAIVMEKIKRELNGGDST
jgi:hypothetical protein